MIDTLMPELSECRVLASLLADACERHLAQNNPDQAMRCIQAIFQVEASLVLETHNPVIHYLVGTSIQGLGINTLENALPHLGKQQSPHIRQCLQHLHDESMLRASSHRSLGIERLGFVDMYRHLLRSLDQGTMNNTLAPENLPKAAKSQNQFIRNIWTHDTIWYIQTIGQWRNLFDQTTTLPAFKQARQQTDNVSDEALDKAQNNRYLHPISSMMMPALDAFAAAHYKAVTSRRLAATGLALKLYQLDHGQYPATLDALVPAYLPAIPIDPMDPQGRPLGYLPNGCKLYRSDAYDTGDFSQDEPWTTSPDPAQALPIQGPPVVHNIGPSGVARGCPIEVWDSGKVMSNHKMSNDYALNWFALAPWPTVEPTQAYLERGPEKPFMLPLPDFDLRNSNDAND